MPGGSRRVTVVFLACERKPHARKLTRLLTVDNPRKTNVDGIFILKKCKMIFVLEMQMTLVWKRKINVFEAPTQYSFMMRLKATRLYIYYRDDVTYQPTTFEDIFQQHFIFELAVTYPGKMKMNFLPVMYLYHIHSVPLEGVMPENIFLHHTLTTHLRRVFFYKSGTCI